MKKNDLELHSSNDKRTIDKVETHLTTLVFSRCCRQLKIIFALLCLLNVVEDKQEGISFF